VNRSGKEPDSFQPIEEKYMENPSTPKSKKPRKKVAKKTTAKSKPQSKISKAVAFMKEEVKRAGGPSKLEYGYRKELFERTAKKFGLKASTCATQWGRAK
jgi:hypothetical protein